MKTIYIPVWLDQKLEREDNAVQRKVDLHSSMVRLETSYHYYAPVVCPKIYIPVWLDQKPCKLNAQYSGSLYLHSSMVRLETRKGIQRK